MNQPYFLYLFIFAVNVLQAQQPASVWKAKLDSAAIYQKAAKYAEAITLLEASKTMMEKADSAGTSTHIETMNRIAVVKMNQGKFSEAISIYKHSLKIRGEKFGKLNKEYFSIKNNLAATYSNANQLDSAIIVFVENMKSQKQLFGEQSRDYLSTIGNLAYTYYKKGQYIQADTLFQHKIYLEKKCFGTKSNFYVADLSTIGELYIDMGKYKEAENYFFEALSICDSINGKEHIDYARLLNNIGVLYATKDDFQNGLKYAEEAFTIRKKILNTDHPDYIRSLNNIGAINIQLENYQEAERYLTEAVKAEKKTVGEEHPRYLTAMRNLSAVYIETQDYIKALLLRQEIVDISKRVIGEKHPRYALSLRYLARANALLGNYEIAQKQYEQAMNIYEDVFGQKHREYVGVMNDYAILLNTIGDYQKALVINRNILNIKKEMFGDSTDTYATSLNNLSATFGYLRKYNESISLLGKALYIAKAKYGENSTTYGLYLANLAQRYYQQNRYALADSTYFKALIIQEKAIGKLNTNYADILVGLSNVSFLKKDYSSSINYQKSALKIYQSVTGETHPETLIEEFRLAKYSIAGAQPDSALFYMNHAIPAQMSQIRQTFTFTSERQQAEFLNAQTTHLELPFSLVQKSNDAILSGLACNLSLLVKGLSLQTGTQLKKTAESSEDTSILVLLLQLNTLKTSLNAQYQKLPEKRFRVAELEQEAEATEKKLMAQSTAFRTAMNGLNTNWKSIQASLKPNEAAIEWVHYHHYNKDWTDTLYYAAFIIRPNRITPQFVLTCSEKSLLALLTPEPKTKPLAAINQLYHKNSPLYSLLWQPLEHYLQGCQTLYVSPSGILYRLAFSAIVSPTGTPLTNRYDLHILSHLRSLSAKNTPIPFPNSAALFGGIDYENVFMVKTPTKAKAGLNSRFLINYQTRERSGTGDWPYLPATSKEVNELQRLLLKSKAKVLKYEGDHASEESFKALDGRHTALVHVATHGFAYPKDTAATDGTPLTLLTNPLLRTGLALAGAKRYKTDTSTNNKGKQDGILTAYETAQLNLNGTELAVLSACESGLGDIQGTEGVYGLQRGFKLAGVKKLLMSLWKVNDEAANEWMRTFYSQWQKTNNLSRAYQQTQRQMQTKYPRPDVWAAFVLLE